MPRQRKRAEESRFPARSSPSQVPIARSFRTPLPPHLVPHAKRGLEDQGLTLRAAAPLYSAAFRATHVTARRG